MDNFEVTWDIDDGYGGGSRPHHFDMRPEDIDPYESENGLRKQFYDAMQHEFSQKVSPYCDQEAEFIAWAKQVQAAQAEEGEC